MRVRFLSVSYRFGGLSSNIERRYQELREAMVSTAHGFAYLHASSEWRPPMDVHETDAAFLVKLEVAGVQEDDIELSLYPNALVVHGIRRDDAEHSEVDCFHDAQVRYGLFHADVALPAPIQQEDVTASYRDGFLRIRLPKATPGAPGSSGERSRPSSEGADSATRWQAHAGAMASKL